MKKIKFLILILFFGITSIFWAQTITGKVTDELKSPLLGTTVLEKGTMNGITTDFNGDFSINVVLEASYIGYSITEISVNGRNTLTVKLTEDPIQLEDLAIVGYGVQKKSDLTGSIITKININLT
jgi:iron complex outermembrane receptor protein